MMMLLLLFRQIRVGLGFKTLTGISEGEVRHAMVEVLGETQSSISG